jgi:molecular chaperone DnaK (HSP70)
LDPVKSPRFAIGIDLGTTNSVLSYVDLKEKNARPSPLPIPQLYSLNTVEENPILPSCYYFGTEAEVERHALSPFAADGERTSHAIGQLAKNQANVLPGRVIQSAKSWLSHAGIDREARILPFGSEEISPNVKLSPVEASAAYLDYLRTAWDRFAGDGEYGFSRQRITVTVPASFDEVAQALTRKAAELAGYPMGFRLLEEPQAAFYAWLESVSRSGKKSPRAAFFERLPDLAERPQTVLVCDIGGGTTDLSLFRITALADEPGLPRIERVAVSDHLLLGGDNIDLAVAHRLEQEFKPGGEERLSRRQWNHLVPQAQLLKERILSGERPDTEVFQVAIPGEGANIFQSTLTAAITRAEVRRIVLDGFFPLTQADERPQTRQSGLREIGLPYAVDTAVGRHLAAFLDGRRVDAVLFAGGSLRPRFLQERLLALIEDWQGRRPAHLNLDDMSLAIAQGAAYFGAIKNSERIRAGHARSVYLELHGEEPGRAPQLVCVLPQGFEEGGRIKLATHTFSLLLNQPARFTAYTSTHRPQDPAGTLVSLDEAAFHPLPPLHATLTLDEAGFDPRKTAGQTVKVQLEAALTELGVLELSLAGLEQDKHWRLDFNLRKDKGGDKGARLDLDKSSLAPLSSDTLTRGVDRIQLFYGKKQALGEKDTVKTLIKDLEKLLGQERNQWSLALLRALWPSLYDGITRRGRSLAHENTWLFLAGFCLRPGCGAELDPWRMTQLWGGYDLGLYHKKEKSAQSNWWLMWRRTAGGLSAEQQERLYRAALPELKKSPQEFVEGTKLLGSLERLPLPARLELTENLFNLLLKKKGTVMPHVYWALTRLLSRVPLYTAADSVIPASAVEDYFDRVESLDWVKQGFQPLVGVFASASRMTNTRALDIHDPVRARVIQKLKLSGAKEEQLRLVREFAEVSSEEQNALFGEELPAGLRLVVQP